MIQAVPAGWGLAAAVNQALLYGAALLAMGTALFGLWVRTPPAAQGLSRRIGRHAAAAAGLFYILAVGLVGADLLGSSLLDPRAWAFGLQTTLKDSAGFGIAAMALLLTGFVRPGRYRRLLALAGSALAVASFLVTGHPVVAAPRWVAAPAYALHLLGAAFWIGALAPLSRSVKVLAPAEAWDVVGAFSIRGVTAVGAIVASGVVLGILHLGSWNALTGTPYGVRLLAKVALALLLIGLAAYNKIVLTPALARGVPQAGPRLRFSIAAEFVLLALILAAAVALSLAPPPAEG